MYSIFRRFVSDLVLKASNRKTLRLLGFNSIVFTKVLDLKSLSTEVGISHNNLYPTPFLGYISV